MPASWVGFDPIEKVSGPVRTLRAFRTVESAPPAPSRTTRSGHTSGNQSASPTTAPIATAIHFRRCCASWLCAEPIRLRILYSASLNRPARGQAAPGLVLHSAHARLVVTSMPKVLIGEAYFNLSSASRRNKQQI